MQFEWDDRKAASNLRRHKVTFAEAAQACLDPFALEWLDMRVDYGEERMILVGRAAGAILFVAYTERGDALRIISARRATRHEEDQYYQANAS